MPTRDYSAPDKECDLIMQGGITSGVVYPPAVLKLAPRFRFRNIGGTSAGAIAAAAAAAAELGRSKGGFTELEKVPQQLAQVLSSLFQPARPFRGVFSLFLACLGHRPALLKALHALVLLLWHFWISIAVGLSPAAIYLAKTIGSPRDWREWLAIAAAAACGIALALLFRVLWLAFVELPRSDFGVCSGTQPTGSKLPALTEWIADLLDRLAGTAGRPLTFGDLTAPGFDIDLKMMTTNLSLRRPYSLPFNTNGNPAHENRYVFNVDEWRKLFPDRIMEYLLRDAVSQRLQGESVRGELRYLPETNDMPVVVAVRMSLSFPILLAAVPLYRRDPLYELDSERRKLRRCLFSDGGISSNFPIHFFDAPLPNRPTFAVSLDEYAAARYESEQPEDRVSMPADANSGALLPIKSIDSLAGFIVGIVDSARLWQDNLQKLLSGYRERVTHIALTELEGGLNLNMEAPVIEGLTQLGAIAGDRMLAFDLDEHRWRRFLVTYARLEETFERIHGAYDHGFGRFLEQYPPRAKAYTPEAAWIAEARDRLAAVLQATEKWGDDPLRERPEAKIPRPATDLRITPRP